MPGIFKATLVFFGMVVLVTLGAAVIIKLCWIILSY